MRRHARCGAASLLVGAVGLPVLCLLLFGGAPARPEDLPLPPPPPPPPPGSAGAAVAVVALVAPSPRTSAEGVPPLLPPSERPTSPMPLTPVRSPEAARRRRAAAAPPVGGADPWATAQCEPKATQPMAGSPEELWAAGRPLLAGADPQSAAGRSAARCYQQYQHCTFAGIPISGQCGQCACEPGRTGPACAGFRWGRQRTARDGLAVEGVNTWGGSPMMDDNGTYHMLVAKFLNGSVANWYQTSVIVHAVADCPTGPYRVVGDALLGSGDPDTFDATVTHNPHLARLRDGRYLLFYIGMNCLRHPGPACEREQAIGVASASSLWGPWTRLGRPILTPDRCRHDERTGTHGVVANPSAVLADDGRVLLFYRGVNDDSVMLAAADRWDGPYRRLGMGNILRLRGMRVEDMYVWRTVSGGCNMLVHVQSLKLTRITHKNWVSALFYSPVCNTSNPNYWHLVYEEPYSRCVEVEGQGRVCFFRRERPQLLFRNHSPIVMCTAVDEGTKTSRGTTHRQFTLCSPILPHGDNSSERTV